MADFEITGEISVDLGKAQKGIVDLTASCNNAARAAADIDKALKLGLITEAEAAGKKAAVLEEPDRLV